MGYEVMLMKFEKGEPGLFDPVEFNTALAPFGTLEEGEFGREIIPKSESYMFEYASVMGEEGNTFGGVMFNRPDLNEPFSHLIYALLSLKGTCFFDPNFEFLIGRNIRKNNIPVDILEMAENGLQIANSPNHLRDLCNF